jgi:hypothetical protein
VCDGVLTSDIYTEGGVSGAMGGEQNLIGYCNEVNGNIGDFKVH